MNVKLVSITKPLIDNLELSAEDLIVYIARVSNPNNQLNFETSDRLIGYLIQKKHWSPFDMVDVTVEIKTSRAIAQQILRHVSLKVQEFSQRYSKVDTIEPVQLRYKGETNRQSSSDNLNQTDDKYFTDKIENLFNLSQNLYQEMLDNNIAKECARFVLPISTETTLYVKGSLRSWITYLNVRLDEHTQLEHRDIAICISKIISQEFPNVTMALNNFNDNKGMFI
jgi:thymidylate synthase (FAD)